MLRGTSRPAWRALAVLLVLLLASSAEAAKNVILMIADGAGYNTWLATSMYQGKVGGQVYDGPNWVRVSCTTYPLNLSHKPTGSAQQDEALVYDAAKAWNANDGSRLLGGSAGYRYLKATPTDSAAAATTLATGRKTYNNAINWSNENRPMQGETIAEVAKAQGKLVGVVTSVPWSHATPAGLGGAHNISRNNPAEIAREMLNAAWLKVMMGAGNPDYDDDGQPLPASKKRDYQWVGGQKTWETLKSGKLACTLVESREDFEKLTTGPTPSKVVGVAQVAETLQVKRGSGWVGLARSKVTAVAEPFSKPCNKNVPTLAVMSRAALNCLDDGPQGFFLMIEGGAVDWANHANEQGRMIEEQIDFNKAVESVVNWIEKHSSWDETLLIITADHECGLLWGPDSAKVAFQPLVDHGAGKLPGMHHNSFGHSNSLVPLFARGPGSQRFTTLVRGQDAKAAEVWQVSGQYLDNTDVFRVIKEQIGRRE